MLREKGASIGLSRDFLVYDSDDQISVVKECLRELSLDEKKIQPRVILSMISRAKEQMVSPDGFSKVFHGQLESIAGSVYRKYEERLTRNRALDFDDLILKAVRMLQEREDVREAHMRSVLRDARKAGHARIAVVCGAWHVPALAGPGTAAAGATPRGGIAGGPPPGSWASPAPPCANASSICAPTPAERSAGSTTRSSITANRIRGVSSHARMAPSPAAASATRPGPAQSCCSTRRSCMTATRRRRKDSRIACSMSTR